MDIKGISLLLFLLPSRVSWGQEDGLGFGDEPLAFFSARMPCVSWADARLFLESAGLLQRY